MSKSPTTVVEKKDKFHVFEKKINSHVLGTYPAKSGSNTLQDHIIEFCLIIKKKTID